MAQARREMNLFSRLLCFLVLPIIALTAIDWQLAVMLNRDAPHTVTVLCAGLLSFAVIYSSERDRANDPGTADAALRSAIAIAVIVPYLVLVSIVAFFPPAVEGDRLSAITQPLITSFTTVVSVVIGFYFGSSALVQIQQHRSMPAQQSPATISDPNKPPP
jgi:hypothetical protein